MARTLTTRCCIAGGGPAGVMLGHLLARSGIDVIVLEKWPDFFRDFRGDTIHPSTMGLLKELGLLEAFLKLPHNETKKVAVHLGGEEIEVANFTRLKRVPPFLGFTPQWDFLHFLAKDAAQYPEFHLLMSTEAKDLILEGDRVVGVRAADPQGELEIRAELVVGADGRHSTVRERSGLRVTDLGAPIDVLWFKLPRKEDAKAQSLGYVNEGKMLVMLDRDSYWQCALIIRKGGFEEIKARGLEPFRQSIAGLVPLLAGAVGDIRGWEDVKLLSVTLDRLERWYLPGLICIGDAAHAMSPVGGVGINLAVQDAVAAANVLVPAFAAAKGVTLADLKAIQERRLGPALFIQKAQAFIHARILEPILRNHARITVPWQLKLFKYFPPLRRIPAYLIGVGIRPEHIRTHPVPLK